MKEEEKEDILYILLGVFIGLFFAFGIISTLEMADYDPSKVEFYTFSHEYIEELYKKGMEPQTLHFIKYMEDNYLLIPPDKIIHPIIHPLETCPTDEKIKFAELISEISSLKGIDTDIYYVSGLWEKYLNGEEFEYYGYEYTYFIENIKR